MRFALLFSCCTVLSLSVPSAFAQESTAVTPESPESPTAAQDPPAVTAARALAFEALEDFKAERFEEAALKFPQAFAVVQVPSLALYTARAMLQVGRLVEAAEYYEKAGRLEATGSDHSSEETQVRAQELAKEEYTTLLPRVPKIRFEIVGAEAEQLQVAVDGVQVPPELFQVGRLSDPGDHKIEASMGDKLLTQSLSLKEGEGRTVVLDFGAVPSSTMPVETNEVEAQTSEKKITTREVLAWTAVGVGGAGLILGTVTGVMMGSERKSLNDAGCNQGDCYSDQKSDYKDYNTLRTVSMAGFIGGGVLLATGVTLLLIGSGEKEQMARQNERHITPIFGLSYLGASGRF